MGECFNPPDPTMPLEMTSPSFDALDAFDALRAVAGSSVKGVLNMTFDIFAPDERRWEQFVFPDFQRPYRWEAEDVKKLLDDVDELRWDTKTGAYFEAEYYFGAICLRSETKEGMEKKSVTRLQILDGQQRLTSLMIVAHLLHRRAQACNNEEIRALADEMSALMGEGGRWKRHFQFEEPQTVRHIREVYRALDADDAHLRANTLVMAQIDGERPRPTFFEMKLLRDLKRFLYILKHGRLAVTVLRTTKEAEQFFQAENNRGLRMSLLDMLKAYHMRLETDPSVLAEIQTIWSRFNIAEPNPSDGDDLSDTNPAVERRRRLLDMHVLPALLLRHGVSPRDLVPDRDAIHLAMLKGIAGTRQGDRAVDLKRREASRHAKRVFDLMDPVEPGFGFFLMLDQYLRIDEALALVTETLGSDRECLLNPFQQQILRLMLIAWIDRFGPAEAIGPGVDPAELAKRLTTDWEFLAYRRMVTQFLSRLYHNQAAPDLPPAYSRLQAGKLLYHLHCDKPQQSLILLPHRTRSPSDCRRAFLDATRPEALPFIKVYDDKRFERYAALWRRDFEPINTPTSAKDAS